jgi:hypothetical protein
MPTELTTEQLLDELRELVSTLPTSNEDVASVAKRLHMMAKRDEVLAMAIAKESLVLDMLVANVEVLPYATVRHGACDFLGLLAREPTARILYEHEGLVDAVMRAMLKPGSAHHNSGILYHLSCSVELKAPMCANAFLLDALVIGVERDLTHACSALLNLTFPGEYHRTRSNHRRTLFDHQGLVAAIVGAVLCKTSCAFHASDVLLKLSEEAELCTPMLSNAALVDALFHGASQNQTSENCFMCMSNLCCANRADREKIYNHPRFSELGVPRCDGWWLFLDGRAAGVKLADESFAALEQALVHLLPTVEEWKQRWLRGKLAKLPPFLEREAASKIAAADAAEAAAAALLGELEATDEAAKSARAKKTRKKERKRAADNKKKREAEEERAGREELTPFQQWEMSEQAHQRLLVQRKRTRNLEEAAAIMLGAGSPSPPPFKRGKTADDIEAQIQALGLPPTFPASVSYERDAEVESDAQIESDAKIESDLKIESVLAMVEREAAAEIAMKIAALPDDPPLPPPPPRRAIGSRVKELQFAVHAQSASLAELEAELGRSAGEETLVQRVAALHGTVGCLP